MTKTSIEWAMNPDGTRGEVWNPVTGCNKVSQGCKNCYAERIAERFWGDRPFTEVRLHPERLDMPLHWKKPRRVFVNSMSDLFHDKVDQQDSLFVRGVFNVMRETPQHTYIVLTKRPENMQRFMKHYPPPRNVWLGVSVENADHLDRIDLLRRTHAAVRFISFEPLLGPVDNVDLTGIHWVIVGGESGPNARPMHQDWARSLRDQSTHAGVNYFFKQWGEWTSEFPQGKDLRYTKETYENGTVFYKVGKKVAGRLLDGREWNEYPESVK